MDMLKTLFKQPYWVIALILGVMLIAFPCVTIDKDYHWMTHPPSTFLPVVIGIGLLLLSSVCFGVTLLSKPAANADGASAGLDLTRVKESDGVLWTTVSGCEIRVAYGHIEEPMYPLGWQPTRVVSPYRQTHVH